MAATKQKPLGLNLPKLGLTTFEVSQVAQVTLRQLQWWDERKLVSPHHEGHKRFYRPDQVLEVIVVAELRRKGLPLQKIWRVLRSLRRQTGWRISHRFAGEVDLYLLTDGKSTSLEDHPGRIIEILKKSKQPMLLVCMSDHIRRLAQPPKKPAGRATSAAEGKTRAV